MYTGVYVCVRVRVDVLWPREKGGERGQINTKRDNEKRERELKKQNKNQ